jgi:hypothetical protein
MTVLMPIMFPPTAFMLPSPSVSVPTSVIYGIGIPINWTRFINHIWDRFDIAPRTVPGICPVPIPSVRTPPDSMIESDIFSRVGCVVNFGAGNYYQFRLRVNRCRQDKSEFNPW